MKNKIKKFNLYVALVILVWGIARIDCDGWSSVIAIAIGGSYLFMSIIANWDMLVRHGWTE